MHVCVHVCAYTYINTYVCARTHTHTHTHSHPYVDTQFLCGNDASLCMRAEHMIIGYIM